MPRSGLGKVREFGQAANLVSGTACGCARFAASVPGGSLTWPASTWRCWLPAKCVAACRGAVL